MGKSLSADAQASNVSFQSGNIKIVWPMGTKFAMSQVSYHDFVLVSA
jgi:hypothetical protein